MQKSSAQTIGTFAQAEYPWFKVRFNRFGYSFRGIIYPARWMIWNVQAKNAQDALRIARARYRRADNFSILEPENKT